jgi:hypothetical protein
MTLQTILERILTPSILFVCTANRLPPFAAMLKKNLDKKAPLTGVWQRTWAETGQLVLPTLSCSPKLIDLPAIVRSG